MAWLPLQGLKDQALQTAAGAHILEAFATSPQAVPAPLSSELAVLVADLRLLTLPEALNRWAGRVGIIEARSLAETLSQHQRLGFPLADALTREESHCLAMLRQAARRRIQATAATLAAITALLLLNALLLFIVPTFYSLAGLQGF